MSGPSACRMYHRRSRSHRSDEGGGWKGASNGRLGNSATACPASEQLTDGERATLEEPPDGAGGAVGGHAAGRRMRGRVEVPRVGDGELGGDMVGEHSLGRDRAEFEFPGHDA